MKAFPCAFSIVLAVVAIAGAAPALAASPGACATASDQPVGDYPSFCSIPQPPRDVRSAAQFKSAVVEARLAARALTRATASMPASLPPGSTEAFADRARAEATPPPPMSSATDAAEFARRAREEATPPPKPH